MGDFNAHHYLLRSNNNNSNGDKIIDLTDEFDLIILNEKISTRLGNPNNHISPLDLTLVSKDIALNCNWKMLEDCGNSDHFPT